MGERYFSDKLVKWYLENSRPLPWRATKDPYQIWLSEVILQQTRVAQGLPYYQRFIESFPTVQHLAAASEQDVLRLWQGLGYYTRARNLHKCAKVIVERYDGKFPCTYDTLLELPGIGTYTAAAIASFSFGEPVAVVDGNVFRVLSRLFGIDIPVNSPQGKKIFFDLAHKLISRNEPALHNQAAMEFGAIHCTPNNPRCDDCIFKASCVAYHQNLVNSLPIKTAAKKARKRYFFYVVIEQNNSLLMRKRDQGDIWHGLFDFGLIEKDRPVSLENLIRDTAHNKWFKKAERVAVSKKYVHVLSHQIIHCRFIRLRARPTFEKPGKDLNFYSPAEIDRLPKPALITRYLDEQNRR